MPSVFLSYSREDLSRIEELEAQLKTHPDISIWRDQEKIYGGQKWPKVLGEAIADQDVFLLAWSKHAAASHFVEFEWCTALALKKTVILYLLDRTTLPPSLASTQGILVGDILRLVASLANAPLTVDKGRRADILSKFDQIKATKSEDVLKTARTLFEQQKWMAQGNALHGENVPVKVGQRTWESAKGLAEKWQIWVGLAGTLLTVISVVSDLHGKLDLGWWPSKEEIVEQKLAGKAQDTETGEFLPGVDVTLPDFGLTLKTNRDGYFEFRVPAPKEDKVTVVAKIDGYVPAEPKKQILGNTKVIIPLRKKVP